MLLAPKSCVAAASLLIVAVVLAPSVTRADEEQAKVLDRAILPQRDANQLREQLLQVPEVGWTKLDAKAFAELSKQLGEERDVQGRAVKNKVKLPEALLEPLPTQSKQWESCSLTVLGEPDCRITSEKAKSLEKTAALVRQHRMVSMPDREGKMIGPKPGPIGSNFYAENFPFKSGSAVPSAMLPALVQMIEPEAAHSRAVLIELLSHNQDATASASLAKRAIFDVDPYVRQYALTILKERKPADYRQTLLDAFRYPWSPAADHAAEALVAVADREALPPLKQLLDAPSPDMPFSRSGSDLTPMVRDVVRINHLRNCVLCHALSSDLKESLVAQAPVPGSPLSPQFYQGRSRSESIFVRADLTYLRQDFSLALPVANAKPWPDEQRFDFVVRTREATMDEVAAAQTPPTTYPQREAVRFAIRELGRMAAKEPEASVPGK